MTEPSGETEWIKRVYVKHLKQQYVKTIYIIWNQFISSATHPTVFFNTNETRCKQDYTSALLLQ